MTDVPTSDVRFIPPEGWLVADSKSQVSVAVKDGSGNITVVESFFLTALVSPIGQSRHVMGAGKSPVPPRAFGDERSIYAFV